MNSAYSLVIFSDLIAMYYQWIHDKILFNMQVVSEYLHEDASFGFSGTEGSLPLR